MHVHFDRVRNELPSQPWVALVLVLFFGLTGWFNSKSPASGAEREEPSPPKLNVVFILADDLGWGELGCYGQTKIPTPNIDRLAAEGMRFTQHYSGAPVCAPSRCVLMTGKHLGHAEIRGNRQAKLNFPEFTEGQHPLSAASFTVAQAFQQAGYTTGAMGKWGLGPVGSTGDPNKKGFDLFFGYNCQAVAHSYYPAYLWRNSERVTINVDPISGHHKPVDGEIVASRYQGLQYAPYLMIAEAERFIKDNRERPFFLYLPFIEPHVAMHPPQDSVDRFPTDWDEEAYRGESGYLPHPRPHAGYAAMISDLDSYVGKVTKAIHKAGLEERTLVVFTSDNGTTHEGPKTTHFHVGGADPTFFNSTAGLRGFKGSVYEGGIRVPMILKLPGAIKAGSVNHTPSYFADWFPTLCNAAKIEIPSGLDGENLWPVMTSEETLSQRNPMIWVFPEYRGQVAVRMGDMKVLRRDLQTKKPSDWEVYDLNADAAEQHDLAGSHPGLIRDVEKLLSREVDLNSQFPLVIPGVSVASP